MGMIVKVGSSNPVKIQAALQAFQAFYSKVSIYGESTESGVSDQPMSAAETSLGAINRAQACAQDSDYSVGIEGGICSVEVSEQKLFFEQTWAAVHQTKSGIYHVAAGPSFPVAPHVVELLQEGYNLSDAMAKEYGTTDLGLGQGYNGWLSDNHYDRTESSKIAVLLALSMHKKY